MSDRKKAIAQKRRNEFGGLLVERSQIESMFDFFHVSKHKGLTESDIRKYLHICWKELSPDKFKLLMNDRAKLTVGRNAQR